MNRDGILTRVGRIEQLAGLRPIVLDDGKARGIRAVDFSTGSGLNFSVLIDRGLDISRAEFQGAALSWLSATGEVAPEFFEPEGFGWIRSFFGGLLTTCGLTYCGWPCEDEGEVLGLHGRISNIPAEEVALRSEWEGDEYVFSVSGKVREAKAIGENVMLVRTISTGLGEKRLFIEDEVINAGSAKTPHMLLYHINLGFPLLSEDAELLATVAEVTPRDALAEEGKEDWNKFQPPTSGYEEKVYSLDHIPDSEGFVKLALLNRNFAQGRGLGVYLKYRKDELPYFVEWKMMAEGAYVVGVEPANCPVAPRSELRKKDQLPFLKPGERRHYRIEIGVLSSKEEISDFEGELHLPGIGEV